MEQHFVTFYSPGTFFSETTTKTIPSWDTAASVEMARGIVERYEARPYAFRFSTRSRGPDDLDSRVTAQSGYFFLGGKVLTLSDVEGRNDPKDHILISNMRNNGYDKIVVNTNSWKWTQPLGADDVVLDVVFRVPSDD